MTQNNHEYVAEVVVGHDGYSMELCKYVAYALPVGRHKLYSAPVAARPAFDTLAHLQRQREWSERTFGPGRRTAGVCDHIRKELREIESDPADLREWVDVVILALDGAWRTGATPQQIVDAIVAKQTKNEGRVWPDWRTADPNKAIEHDRAGDNADQQPVSGADESAELAKARHDSAHAKTERERVLALAYWLDQQKFEPGMLNCAAETLRDYLRKREQQAALDGEDSGTLPQPSGNAGELPPLPKGYVIQMTPDPDSTPAEWFDETDMRDYARAALAQQAKTGSPVSGHPIPQYLRDAFDDIEVRACHGETGMAVFTQMRTKVQAYFELQQASTDNRTSSHTVPECLRDAFSVTAIEAAAKALTGAMGWSWVHMPPEGRDTMRKNARKAIDAARAAAKAQP